MSFQTHEQHGLVFLTSSLLEGVVHGFSTRKGGVSAPPWDSLNLRTGAETPRPIWRRTTAASVALWGPMWNGWSWPGRSTRPRYAPAPETTRARACGVPGTTTPTVWYRRGRSSSDGLLRRLRRDPAPRPGPWGRGRGPRRVAGLCGGILAKAVREMTARFGSRPATCWQP